MTDGDQLSVNLASENAALNSVNGCIHHQKLLWYFELTTFFSFHVVSCDARV